MCDDNTLKDLAAWQAADGITRRELARFGTGALAAGMLAGCGAKTSTAKAAAPLATKSSSALISGAAGKIDGFFVTPTKGKHPAVIMWPDVAGLREAYQTMATRLAAAGYAVLVPNPYYRSSPSPVLSNFAEWRSEAGQAKIGPMRTLLTAEAVTQDARDIAAWLDQQPETDRKRAMAAMGYCMSGSFTFRAAAALPERIKAIGSFHGGGLATAEADSPHLLMPAIRAHILVAIAENDDAREPDAKVKLREAAFAAGRNAEIEVYPAQHGWCTLDSPAYSAAEADRAWSRMLAIFEVSL